MKTKIRVNGTLPGEKEVVLGYVTSSKQADKLMTEYKEVFTSITFRVTEVIMLPYKKGVALVNFMSALSGQPVSSYNSMFNVPKKRK